jgi:hypothetical protein
MGVPMSAQGPSQAYANQPQAVYGNIAPDVYQKIREVDQQPSTLTQQGVNGLSARIVER